MNLVSPQRNFFLSNFTADVTLAGFENGIAKADFVVDGLVVLVP